LPISFNFKQRNLHPVIEDYDKITHTSCDYSALLTYLYVGLMSGLTLGLLSLDVLTLEILIKSGTPTQRKHAIRIMPLVKRHHLLLVTLLLCNAASMEVSKTLINQQLEEKRKLIVP
jgi:hypothetical protein